MNTLKTNKMEFYQNISLKEYNSFRTEAFAKHFCQPESIEEIIECLNTFPHEKQLIIGGGCNLFFTQNFDGIVMKLKLHGIREELPEKDHVLIEAMASEDWDDFVAYCTEKGYAGLENLSLIPGTVGASPVQNIGAYGAEVKDCIQEVKAIDINTQKIVSFSNKECLFAYRDSVFKQKGGFIITSVVFKLQLNYQYTPKYKDLNEELKEIASPTIKEVRDAVISIRKRKLPDEKELPNCGSFFKNPYITKEQAEILSREFPELPVFPHEGNWLKTSAAFLIDKAGYKGKREGNIGSYPKQPLIIVNYGSSDGNDIIKFMQEIQKAVKALFQIELEPEVRIL
ncbi:UDP-N-acetylmuramate dehydrogenase [Odoribacter sp. OttesenSCG-928-A06]|nr:UDP-N-acetylmuramate dehydrogenase [Odoribacter sp. OttesenSCG-928-A06]